MNHIPFSREKTQILKGIALLLMLVHHTSLPDHWAEDGTTLFSYLEHQVFATKFCVWIFAFLVGYGFFCSINKTLKYSLKRISLLVIPFWAMLFGMFIPAAYFSGGLAQVMGDSLIGGQRDLLQYVWIFGVSELV